MQSDINEVLFFDFDKLLSVLYKFSFPNIPVYKTSDFLTDILNLYKTNLDIINNQNKYNDANKEFLFHLINSKKNKKYLIFLKDNKNYVISDRVDYLYLSRVLNFPFDLKIFDIEPTIMEKLKFNKSDTKKYKFEFCDSKSVVEIQLSNVVVGFVGRLFSFISHNDKISLSKWISQKCKQTDNDYSLKTLYYFFKLMDISDNKTPLMFNKVIPLYLIERFDFFMKEIVKFSEYELI